MSAKESRRQRTVSVIIPCLNDAPLLARCLDSLNQQTVKPDEILVVDNGSTDDSALVATAFGAKVVREERRGITWATQTGFANASGDIMLRTDADVIAPEQFIEQLHHAWDLAEQQAGRRVVGVSGGGAFELPGLYGRAMTALYLGAYRLTSSWALGHQPFFGTNYSIRRTWWESISDTVDFSDTVVHEDMHLSFAVRPDETVWLQKDLVLPMDPRALQGFRQVCRRFYRGFHTIAVNWRQQLPQERLSSRGKLPEFLDRMVRS